MTDELKRKVERAVKLIQSAGKVAQEHGYPLEICYSGGKDSDVILELARMSGVNYRAIYKNTTIDPPGTIAHARSKGVEIMQPKMSFRALIAKKGLPSRWRRFCCGVLKEYKVLDYAVVGIRRDESRARSERYREPEQCRVYSKREAVRQYFPILDWKATDVADFIRERGIKCHSLYYDDFGKFHVDRRLGCMCCPLQSQRKRIESFKEHPQMVRFYIKALQKFFSSHPLSKVVKIFNGNVYDAFTAQVFCNGQREFHDRFKASDLFGDDAIDTKAFLYEQFKIQL